MKVRLEAMHKHKKTLYQKLKMYFKDLNWQTSTLNSWEKGQNKNHSKIE